MTTAHRSHSERRVQAGPASSRLRLRRRPGPDASGFHECWKSAFGWQDDDFAGGTVLDIWNFKKKGELIEQGILKPRQLTEEDIEIRRAASPARRA